METVSRLKQMKKQKGTIKQFVICIDNSEYLASLELHKVYRVLPDTRAAADGFMRVVDESGEDYLYSAKRFVSVELPRQVERSVTRRIRETARLADKTLQPSIRASRPSATQKNSRASRG